MQQYTRVTSTSKTMTVLVLINNTDNISCEALTTPKIWDHSVIKVSYEILENTKKPPKNETGEIINFDKLCITLISNDLLYETSNVNSLYDNFNNTISNALNISTSRKT